MCQILYDETKERAKYVFGKWVENYKKTGDGVEVRFSDGTLDRFDLIVSADGQRSYTRRMLLGADGTKSIKYLGRVTAYFTVLRDAQPGEEYRARGTFGIVGRFLMTRRHNAHQLQVYLGCGDDHPELKNIKRGGH